MNDFTEPTQINNCYIELCDFPGNFNIMHANRLTASYHFDQLNIKHVLYYSNYIGVEKEQQRLFSMIFMRCMPQYLVGEGAIELDTVTNRLIVYIQGCKPINLAQISYKSNGTNEPIQKTKKKFFANRCL